MLQDSAKESDAIFRECNDFKYDGVGTGALGGQAVSVDISSDVLNGGCPVLRCLTTLCGAVFTVEVP